MLHPRIVATVFVVGSLSLSCSEDSCFIGDTEVATPAGNRRIAELAVGDEVYSFDHERGELVVRKVQRIFTSQVTTVCRVDLGGLSIRGVTPSHPFFDAQACAYLALRDLPPDARLLRLGPSVTAPLSPAGVERIAIDERAEPSFTVYNLEVEGPEHNYFADGVLVHNKGSAGNSCPDYGGDCTGSNCTQDGLCNCIPGTIADGSSCKLCPEGKAPNSKQTRCLPIESIFSGGNAGMGSGAAGSGGGGTGGGGFGGAGPGGGGMGAGGVGGSVGGGSSAGGAGGM